MIQNNKNKKYRFGELLNLFGECCAKKYSLPIRPNVLQNHLYLGCKAHVEASVWGKKEKRRRETERVGEKKKEEGEVEKRGE